MTFRATVWAILCIVGIGLAGYGLGSGWVRLGPPAREAASSTVPQLERPADSPEATGVEINRGLHIDNQVIQAQAAGTATAAPPGSTGSSTPTKAAATTTPAAPTPAATTPAAAASITAILEPETGASGTPAPLYMTTDFTQPIRLRSNFFWVSTDSPDPNATVKVGTVTGVFDSTLKLLKFDLSTVSPPLVGRARLSLTLPSAVTSTGQTTVDLIIPQPALLTPPTITKASNGKFADPAAIPTDAATPLSIYGSWVRILGQDGPAVQNALDFYIYVNSGSYYVFKGVVSNALTGPSSTTQSWDATLSLPIVLPAGQEARIFAVSSLPANQQFSTNRLRVERTQFTIDPNAAPKIEGIYLQGPTQANTMKGVRAPTDPSNPSRFFANQSTLAFHGTGLVNNAVVVVYLDGQQDNAIAISSTSVPNLQPGEWWTDLSKDIPVGKTPHTVRATVAQGSQITAFSDPVTVQVNKDGPKLDSVGVSIPGPDLGVQLLTVRFTGNPLDATKAGTKTNFGLLHPSDTTNTPITPDTAVYDSTRNSVALQYSGLRPDAYTLVLTPTAPGSPTTILTDIYGNAIAGKTSIGVTNSTDGSDGDTIPKPEKAPNAVFPEFNNPRPEANGFNPSDHVDTRVSRLYFYRDARRVAEIINRDLKSYNQSAVDTRRRLAEKARTAADTLTDQRRLQEIKAVRAAQTSREAQRRVDQAQTAVQQNQAVAGNASQSLIQLQAQKNDLQQRLTQATAASTPPAGATPATTDPDAAQNQKAAARTVASLTAKLDDVNTKISLAQDQSNQAASQIATQTQALQSAQNDLQSARQKEADSSDETVTDQAQEDRARESQFRLEVAAAQEDPNSYVPGQPDSVDPVLQVSISVIGEGVIQLRGPIKGINIIRRMINEIDTPAGQVRIAIHTAQINGEHEARMEKVASRIQAYVDHSRFLTVQSAQMLRNAMIKVASRKAEEVCASLTPEQAANPKYAAGQELRDRKYQEAFFGIDFINELHTIDSEFLHTGNKLLSLHSMDTTSLASALFMLALAKNETRLEILQEFKAMLEGDLPEAENTFELSSGRTGKEHHHKVLPLAQNARFQSFIGFFNSEVAGNDTLNPLQREFIKLAQILKSRLVVELEYNQRFKERGLIEDRLGNYLQELQDQRDREAKAKKAKESAREKVSFQRAIMSQKLVRISGLLGDDKEDLTYFRKDIDFTKQVIDGIIRENAEQLAKNFKATPAANAPQDGQMPIGPQDGIPAELVNLLTLVSNPRTAADAYREVNRLDKIQDLIKKLKNATFTYNINGQDKQFFIQDDADGTIGKGVGTADADLELITSDFFSWIERDNQLRKLVSNFVLPRELRPVATEASILLDHLYTHDTTGIDPATGKPTANRKLTRHVVFEYYKLLTLYSAVINEVQSFVSHLQDSAREITKGISIEQTALEQAHRRWMRLKEMIDKYFLNGYKEAAAPLIGEIEDGFDALDQTYATFQNAQREAQEARQPLDAKKLLDLLIDEIEDKYIELLEGIRAHTANIDGYVKSIATALDDDFNNQFYYPAFKEIRKSSSYWDVQLGQVETTNILTNNRMFAKVEPQATMEFDLPKRDILINEAMNGAKALMDSYGALVADPSFLALTKMQSGQPTSSPAQGFGSGGNTVRNVLPGLPRSNDEQLLSQAPAGRKEFGSPLEALIPDPAIYKFETGTGFEIRPVIQPDGQSVVFHLDYMYTTNVREPVRADEKHLGRIKRHFIDTEVQLGNYELREISRYVVALKASRTGRGVPLLEDIPGLGLLFRPLPSASSSLQQNVIMGKATIFPTLFDLMGLRIAPAVADLDTLRVRNTEFSVRGRARDVMNRVFDYSTSRVDEYLRVPPAERRPDLYRSQETVPDVHPNGYQGPGLNLRDSQLQEGYDPTRAVPPSGFIPGDSGDNERSMRERAGSARGHHQGVEPAPAATAPGQQAPDTHDAPAGMAPAATAPGISAPAAPAPAALPPDAAAPGAAEPPASTLLPSGSPGAYIPKRASASAKMSQRASASGDHSQVKPGGAAPPARIPAPVTRNTTTARVPRPRIAQPTSTASTGSRVPQPPSTVSTGPRVTKRPVNDPATVRASATAPAPAPAKTGRKSVLSRIFTPDK